jgi:hypothetical protein
VSRCLTIFVTSFLRLPGNAPAFITSLFIYYVYKNIFFVSKNCGIILIKKGTFGTRPPRHGDTKEGYEV